MNLQDQEWFQSRFDRLEDKIDEKTEGMDARLRRVETHAHVGSVLGSIGALIASGIVVHLITVSH